MSLDLQLIQSVLLARLVSFTEWAVDMYNPLLYDRPWDRISDGPSILNMIRSNREAGAQRKTDAEMGATLSDLATYGKTEGPMYEEMRGQLLSNLSNASPQMRNTAIGYISDIEKQNQPAGLMTENQKRIFDMRRQQSEIEPKLRVLERKILDSGTTGAVDAELLNEWDSLVANYNQLAPTSGERWRSNAGIEAEVMKAQKLQQDLESKKESEKQRLEEIGMRKEGLALQKEQSAREKEKFNIEKTEKSSDRLNKELSARALMPSDAYDSQVQSAESLASEGNIFGAVKMISGIIEPGLSVTNDEVKGYLTGGESAFTRFMKDKIGSDEKDLNKILKMLKGLADIKKRQALEIESQFGKKYDTKTSTPSADSFLKKFGRK